MVLATKRPEHIRKLFAQNPNATDEQLMKKLRTFGVSASNYEEIKKKYSNKTNGNGAGPSEPSDEELIVRMASVVSDCGIERIRHALSTVEKLMEIMS